MNEYVRGIYLSRLATHINYIYILPGIRDGALVHCIYKLNEQLTQPMCKILGDSAEKTPKTP